MGLLWSAGAFEANAGEWRRAGSAAGAQPQAAAEANPHANSNANQIGTRSVMQRVAVAPPRAAGEQFDPFDEPLSDADAAMPKADRGTTVDRGTADPGNDDRGNADHGNNEEFDPFETPAGQGVRTPAAAPSIGPAIEPAVEPTPEPETVDAAPAPQTDVEEPQTSGRRPVETFDVQEAFDEPRGAHVGPSVEGELDDAGRAVDEEIKRRGGRAPRLPGNEGADPFTPGDAHDGPRRKPAGDVEETFPDPKAPAPGEGTDEGMTAEDLDLQYQQAPGGYQFRPLDQQPPQTPEQLEAHRREIEKERVENEKNCETIVSAVKSDDIKTVSLSIRTTGEAGEDYPFECGLGEDRFKPRSWSQITYLWKAAGLCHKPLYFEQVQLERYGHSWSPALQPLLSGAHFFGTLPVLPYKMGLQTPNECVYTLGYYRPGSCAPYMIEAVPFTWRAAAFEGAAWTAGVIVIP